MGSPTDHHAAPYAMTEEFAACYRMHSLIPDDYSFRRGAGRWRAVRRDDARRVARQRLGRCTTRPVSRTSVYSIGTSHPGALVLHNFPNALRRLPVNPEKGVYSDLAAIDILRDRERGIPRYCAFRRMMGMKAPKSFEELTTNPEWRKEIAAIYSSVEEVDLLVGTLAESNGGTPLGFGFSDTVFRIFILMASRRLKSDRFFTTRLHARGLYAGRLRLGRGERPAAGARAAPALAEAAFRRDAQHVLPVEEGRAA